MKQLIIYADNSMCLDGCYLSADAGVLKRFGIPEERHASYIAAAHPERIRARGCEIRVYAVPVVRRAKR